MLSSVCHELRLQACFVTKTLETKAVAFAHISTWNALRNEKRGFLAKKFHESGSEVFRGSLIEMVLCWQW